MLELVPIRIRKGQVLTTVAADLKCHKGAFCHKYALLHSLVDFKKGSPDGAMETAARWHHQGFCWKARQERVKYVSYHHILAYACLRAYSKPNYKEKS